MRFANRRDAGRRLGAAIKALGLSAPVVIALPRGGVPVGFEVAAALDAPLEVLVARKVGAPGQPELGVGAIAEGGITVFDNATLRALGLTSDDLADTVRRETDELLRRVQRYRGDAGVLPLEGRTAIVVDDGLATGGTARAALRSVRRRNPSSVVLAVPVAPPDAATFMTPDADTVVVEQTPDHLLAVGQWYDDFTQTSDDEVVDLLREAGG